MPGLKQSYGMSHSLKKLHSLQCFMINIIYLKNCDKLTFSPVLSVDLHEWAAFWAHFHIIEEALVWCLVYIYPSKHNFNPPLLLVIISTMKIIWIMTR